MSAFRVGDRVETRSRGHATVEHVNEKHDRYGVTLDETGDVVTVDGPTLVPLPPVDDASFAAALEERGWKSYPCAYYTDGEWGLRAGRLQAPLDDIRTGAPTLAEARRRVIELVDEREALRGGDDG